ncbi:MAG: hypothetical protein WC986_13560 [Elusimicrobiota bacterium]|jgi:hypothetical protein
MDEREPWVCAQCDLGIIGAICSCERCPIHDTASPCELCESKQRARDLCIKHLREVESARPRQVEQEAALPAQQATADVPPGLTHEELVALDAIGRAGHGGELPESLTGAVCVVRGLLARAAEGAPAACPRCAEARELIEGLMDVLDHENVEDWDVQETARKWLEGK